MQQMFGPSVVETQAREVAILERFGRFSGASTSDGGLRRVNWPIEKVREVVSLQVRELDVRAETKTLDNTFITVKLTLQYRVNDEKVFEAFYALKDARKQIASYVIDAVRAVVPQMPIEEAFASKDRISQEVESRVVPRIAQYGYDVVNTLVTDVEPAPVVKRAMNEVQRQKRLREATLDKALALKYTTVQKAQGESESMYLSGVGTARQRTALLDGMRENVLSVREAREREQLETTNQAVMDLLLITQYMDTLRDISRSSDVTGCFYPKAPAGDRSIEDAVRNAALYAACVRSK